MSCSRRRLAIIMWLVFEVGTLQQNLFCAFPYITKTWEPDLFSVQNERYVEIPYVIETPVSGNPRLQQSLVLIEYDIADILQAGIVVEEGSTSTS